MAIVKMILKLKTLEVYSWVAFQTCFAILLGVS